MEQKKRFTPVTPGGTFLMDLTASTETEAWENLMHAARHMPYKTLEDFKTRGYTMDEWEAA